jgi:predicted AlkP superfamily pyrophosphatase or phosphodiesterase
MPRRQPSFTFVLLAALLASTPIRGDLSRPRLIVLLVVDQMRGDYVDKFQQQWTGGLHRLVADGAWFRQVDYPYFDTLTGPGHSTIATGTLPSTHGMVLNVWWDPAEGGSPMHAGRSNHVHLA